jgi:hypothetical protein
MTIVKPFTKEEQHNNLVKLGKYLAKLSKAHNLNHFRMAHFATHSYADGDERRDPYWHDAFEEIPVTKIQGIIKDCFCGTAACAVGHVPLCMPKEFKRAMALLPKADLEADNDVRSEVWAHLSYHLFGFKTAMEDSWQFLFGGIWQTSDTPYYRTSWAAADRIAYYLQHPAHDYSYKHDAMDDAVGASTQEGWITRKLHEQHLRDAIEIAEPMTASDVIGAIKDFMRRKAENEELQHDMQS